MLPLVRPGLAVTALFSFMTAWNEFIMASTFMTDESKYTLPVLIQSSVGQFSADWGLFAAGAVVTSLPVMVAFYVLQRYLVGGLTAGAVKG
jgi:arabinogalactan oligomer/maltooligosaccharide transport system permease protein